MQNTTTPLYSLPHFRPAHDFYPTPPEATRALLAHIRIPDGGVWEPACGDGAIAQVLQAAGYPILTSDLIDRGYGTSGIDFLRQRAMPFGARHIVTNPPYGYGNPPHGFGLAADFVCHAFDLVRPRFGMVAMLLPLAFLCSPTRHDLFVKQPPCDIFALDEIQFLPEGNKTYRPVSSRMGFCWMVWRPGARPSCFHWLRTRDYTGV